MFESIKALCENNPAAQAVSDYAAKTAKKVVFVDQLIEAVNIQRSEIIATLRQFERHGAGRFLVGRRGKRSRFVWSGPARAVCAPTTLLHEDRGGDDGVPKKQIHVVYNLRDDVTIVLKLPTDLSQAEANRLARFVESIPTNVS